MNIKHTLYEVLIPLYPFRKGQTRWLNTVTKALGISAYGSRKKKQVGIYALLLDPGDQNDRHYYFNMVGAGYKFLLERLLRQGDCVIDVGVNVGYFSAISAQFVGTKGQVHGIEASPIMIGRLRQIVAEVSNGPIQFHHSAVWKSLGNVNFNIATNTGWSSLKENDTFETATQVSVQAITLDRFVTRESIKKVRVLKLDIEGAEIDALLGGHDLLSSGLVDYILVEVEPHRLKAFGHTGKELAALMEQNNYCPVCIIENDTIIPLTENRQIPGAFNCDYLYTKEILYSSTIKLLNN